MDTVKTKIEALIRASGAEKVAVAYRDLQTGAALLIHPDERFHAASTMKVPVMMEVYRQAHEGKLSLDDQVPVTNCFTSLADGSPYTLALDDDADTALYQKIGQTDSVRDLVYRMVTLSGNLATNTLMEHVTAPRIMDLMHTLGAKDVQVLRGVEDNRAYERGMNNTTTARGLRVLLERLALHQVVSSDASEEMIKVLLDQKHNNGIPAGLPPAWRVAHKTGSFTGTDHDAGIVFPPGRKPYILVVLTRGIMDEKRADSLIADISRTLYDELSRANDRSAGGRME